MIKIGLDYFYMTYDDFKRDTASNALINKDVAGLERAKAAKLKRRQEKNKSDELENRVARLESLVQDIVLRHTDDGK